MLTASPSRSIRTSPGSNRMPVLSYSGTFQPAPIPSSSRPPLSRSSVAISWASTTGWRRSLLKTKVPRRKRVVTAAATPSAAIGANWSTRWSESISAS